MFGRLRNSFSAKHSEEERRNSQANADEAAVAAAATATATATASATAAAAATVLCDPEPPSQTNSKQEISEQDSQGYSENNVKSPKMGTPLSLKDPHSQLGDLSLSHSTPLPSVNAHGSARSLTLERSDFSENYGTHGQTTNETETVLPESPNFASIVKEDVETPGSQTSGKMIDGESVDVNTLPVKDAVYTSRGTPALISSTKELKSIPDLPPPGKSSDFDSVEITPNDSVLAHNGTPNKDCNPVTLVSTKVSKFLETPVSEKKSLTSKLGDKNKKNNAQHDIFLEEDIQNSSVLEEQDDCVKSGDDSSEIFDGLSSNVSTPTSLDEYFSMMNIPKWTRVDKNLCENQSDEKNALLSSEPGFVHNFNTNSVSEVLDKTFTKAGNNIILEDINSPNYDEKFSNEKFSEEGSSISKQTFGREGKRQTNTMPRTSDEPVTGTRMNHKTDAWYSNTNTIEISNPDSMDRITVDLSNKESFTISKSRISSHSGKHQSTSAEDTSSHAQNGSISTVVPEKINNGNCIHGSNRAIVQCISCTYAMAKRNNITGCFIHLMEFAIGLLKAPVNFFASPYLEACARLPNAPGVYCAPADESLSSDDRCARNY